MSRKILGLDIRRDSLAAVMINGTLQGQLIENLVYLDVSDEPALAATAVPEDAETGGVNGEGEENKTDSIPGDTRGEMLLKLLETLAQKIDITGVDCFVSFPSGDVSYRSLLVPFKNKKKIKQILPFELEPLIPGSVDELALDFMTLEPQVESPDEENEETNLVAAAVNRSLLASFESCLKRGGISPEVIVPGGSMLAGYLCRMVDECSNYVILDLDKDNSTLFLVQGKQIAAVRSFKTGPDRGRQAGLNLIRTVLAFSEQNDVGYEPEAVFVTGPYLKHPGTYETLAKVTGLPVEPVGFLEASGFSLDERIREDWDADLYSGALSLCYGGLYGVRGFTLSQRFMAIGKYISEYRNRLIRTGILAGMVFVALIFNLVFDSFSMNRRIKSYDRQMVAVYKEIFPNATKVVDPYNELKAKLGGEKKKSDFAQSNAGNIRVIDLLNDISQNVDQSLNVDLDRLVLGAEDLKISGTADTYATVDAMKTRLEKIPYFKSVEITSTAGEQTDKIVRFKLTIEFKGAE
jgi:type II secretory pathway component PulL